MKKNYHYHGCQDAKSATAKVVAHSTYWNKYNHVGFYGSLDEAIAAAEKAQNLSGIIPLYYYEVYTRKNGKWVEVEW